MMLITEKKINITDFKKNYKFIIGIVFFGLIITALVYGYYQSIHKLTLSSEIANQKSRAKVLVQKIENYAAVASQIGRTLQNHFNQSNYDQKQIEKFLTESVLSGPEKIIYGVGVSFEPYQFNKNNKFFGPYVHRILQDPSKIILTYEWSTDSYEYTKQGWYKKGISAAEHGVYVEPYFDIDLVYVTLATPFYNSKNKAMGVICVDMVLPQLQKIIDDINSENQEIIYIQSREGFLLAHPQKDLFFAKNKSSKNKSLIHLKTDEFKKILNEQMTDHALIVYKETIADLGWDVIVETQKYYIFKESTRLAWIMFFSLCFLWFVIFLTIYFYVRARKIKFSNKKKNKEHQIQLLNTSRLATLGEFSSGLGHEVNNPLSIVFGKTDLLIDKIENKNIEHSQIVDELKKIKLNAERISKIIKGLRTFSRDGEKDPFIQAFVSEIFVDTFALSSERIKSKKIKFNLINKAEGIKVLCRPSQISQVLLNLLNNSIDAIEKQSMPWISVDVQVSTDIQIIVTDSGLGISPAIVEKIMNPFFTTKDVGRGTGLGLSISYGIIKDHHGELVYNENCKNTQFIIHLPKPA